MSKKNVGKVPPTTQPSEEPQDIDISIPVEIVLHPAASNIRKINTPQGMLTVMTLFSPVNGMGVTVNLSENNVKELVRNLQGSDIVVAETLPSSIIVP